MHRSYLVVRSVDSQQHIVLSPRRFGFESFAVWASIYLNETDAMVLEASANAWVLYDQLEPHVRQVIIAHPLAVKLISTARVKTEPWWAATQGLTCLSVRGLRWLCLIQRQNNGMVFCPLDLLYISVSAR